MPQPVSATTMTAQSAAVLAIATRRDADRAAGRQGIAGVEQKVEGDLFELQIVGGNGEFFVREQSLHAHVRGNDILE